MLVINVRRKNIEEYGSKMYIRVYNPRLALSLPKRFKVFARLQFLGGNVSFISSCFKSATSIYIYVPSRYADKLRIYLMKRQRVRLRLLLSLVKTL